MYIAGKIKLLSYAFKAKPYALEKPIVLQFPVIDICNSQCQMCKIWENKKSDDISADQLRKGLQNSLYSEVTSVGINGGEPTLRKDLASLVAVLFEELPKLQTISLITNAYKSDEVIERMTELGQVAQKHGGQLNVMVSLDGYGDVHDRVRGKPGNFARAEKVIAFAKASPLVAVVNIGCTIIKENVYGMHDLLEYCIANNLYVKYRLGIPHQRLYTRDITEPYALSEAEKYHLVEFLEGLIEHVETGVQQNFFYRSLIGQLVRGQPRIAGCDYQHRGATITSKGELLYCAVESKPLGNIYQDDSSQAYFENAPHLSDIIKSKCDDCNHDYVGLPPKAVYQKQILILILKRLKLFNPLRRLHSGTGLAKWRQFGQHQARKNHLIEAAQGLVHKRGNQLKQVIYCGWYGTETLGDKAILAGVINAVTASLGEHQAIVASLNPYVTRITQAQMPELKNAEVVSLAQALAQLPFAEMLVFAGGPIMAVSELAEIETLFEAAKKANIFGLIAGCGVGPLGEKVHQQAITRILNLADERIYRDDKSLQLAASLGVDTQQDNVAEDPAHSWLQKVNAKAPSNTQTDSPVLLLGLRDFPASQYAPELSAAKANAVKNNFEKAVVEALSRLLDQHPNLTIKPLPMCTNHFGGDDRWFYRRLFRQQAKLRANIDESLLQQELAPLEYAKQFATANAALTMRFHSAVFAVSAELPTVVIDYTLGNGKVASLAAKHALPCLNLQTMKADALFKMLEQQIAQPTKVEPQPLRFEEILSAKLALRQEQRNAV